MASPVPKRQNLSMPPGGEDETEARSDNVFDRLRRRIQPAADLVDTTKILIVGLVTLGALAIGAWVWLAGGDDVKDPKPALPTTPPSTAPAALTSRKSDGALTVSLGQFSEDHTDQRAGEAFLLSSPPPAPQLPARSLKPSDLLVARGALPAHNQSVSLIFSSTEAVTVRAVRPRIIERTPAPSGVIVRVVHGCGADPVRSASVDFDESPPRVEYSEDSSSETQRNLVLSVTESDEEVMSVLVTATADEISWVIDVDYEVNGELRTMTLDHNGAPLRMVGIRPARSTTTATTRAECSDTRSTTAPPSVTADPFPRNFPGNSILSGILARVISISHNLT
jgi:hypothetical protein